MRQSNRSAKVWREFEHGERADTPPEGSRVAASFPPVLLVVNAAIGRDLGHLASRARIGLDGRPCQPSTPGAPGRDHPRYSWVLYDALELVAKAAGRSRAHATRNRMASAMSMLAPARTSGLVLPSRTRIATALPKLALAATPTSMIGR